MKIESRMDEFEKIADKKPVEDVKKRMAEFEQVDRTISSASSDKESTLPFGLKRYKTCPYCGEIMEIHEISSQKAVYRCKTCHKESIQEIG